MPPILQDVPVQKERAPTLYAIIVFKLFKGAVLLLFAFVVFSMGSADLRDEFVRSLKEVSQAAGRSPFGGAEESLQNISLRTIQLIAVGSILYGVFSLVEGVGLIFRASWAGWMVIGESAIFIPLEVWEVLARFSIPAVLILVLNLAIVWYLYSNRRRLFANRFSG
ncbi:MAG TPA: DUF2127 domain-containing protein [Verrucomicrobiae bacterium]